MPSLLHGQAEARRLRWSGRALRAPVRQARREGQEVAIAGADRKAALHAAKLRALVRDHFDTTVDASGTATGAAASDATRAWFLAEERPGRSLGPALAWARQQRVDELHLLAADDTGVLARRSGEFTSPPAVWRVDDRDLTRPNAEPAAAPRPLDPRAESLVRVLRAAGADPVVEHGVLTGEVEGLEVVRAVPTDDGVHLEVGVGRHDREAFQIIHGDVPTAEALASVIATVREHRRAGSPPHPLNRLARERWLRARIVEEPALVGATSLAPVAPPVPRRGLKETTPAVAAGTDDAGRPVVVVCSVGIDLDLVPFAADARLARGGAERLMLAVPERDNHPVTRALAAALRVPAEIVTVPPLP